MTYGWTTRARISAAIGVTALTAVAAGCSSTGQGVGSSDTVRISTVDAVPNGGNASIRVNNGTVEGTQTFFSASDYRFLSPGNSSFTFTFDAYPNITYPTIGQNLVGATTYTVILFGRADLTLTTDPRYPTAEIVTDAQSSAPAGQVGLRVVGAAPDANPVNVIVNGTTVASAVPYLTVGSYVDVAAGSLAVSVVDSTNSKVIVPTTTVAATAGHQYSLYVLEPTITPTYTVQPVLDF